MTHNNVASILICLPDVFLNNTEYYERIYLGMQPTYIDKRLA